MIHPQFILIVTFMLGTACGAEPKKSEPENTDTTTEVQAGSPKPKVSLVYVINNTLETYVKCSATDAGIACTSPPQVLPTFSSAIPMADIDSWSEQKMLSHENGCFEGSIEGSPLGVLSTAGFDKCHLEIQKYNGTNTDGIPSGTDGQPTISEPAPLFSHWFPFLQKYTYVAHLIGEKCTQTLTVRKHSASEYDVTYVPMEPGEGSLTWSSLFSLGFAAGVKDIKMVPKTADLKVPFQPAIDSSELIAKGATDQNVETYFKDHMGDYLYLEIQDGHKAKAFCKRPDSLTGEFTVPASIMAKFDGATSLKLSRHKLTRASLSDTLELVIDVRINQFSMGTDADGRKLLGGSWGVYVK